MDFKHRCCLLGFGVLLLGVSSAARGALIEPEFGLSSGYRSDSLLWNIAGTPQGTDPNIRSELTWKNLQIAQLEGHVSLDIAQNFVLKGRGYYGSIVSGSLQDSDYDSDNRQDEFSRSYSDANGDHVLGGSLSGGPIWHFTDTLQFIPLVGYAWDNQNLRETNGVQALSVAHDQALPLGPFGGLDSTYQTQWKGPWLGFDLRLKATDNLRFLGSFGYHWVSYYAEGDWNLRPDLQQPVSFIDEANGHGVDGSGEVAYQLAPGLWLGLRGQAEDMRATNGTDNTFYSDGTQDTMQFNEVHWTSWSLMATLTVHWGPSSKKIPPFSSLAFQRSSHSPSV